MELKGKLIKIYEEVQESSSCHQRCITTLIDRYNSMLHEDFFPPFFQMVRKLFSGKIVNENIHIDRSMKFSTEFITKISDTSTDQEETHPLLKDTVMQVLKYTISSKDAHRYYSCKFINTLLSSIGEECYVDNDICDAIQEGLMLCLRDHKSVIRITAIKGLYRLQDPSTECPVINAFIGTLKDSDMKVRKATVENIAPSLTTIPKIILRLRDANPKVRSTAFKRLSRVNVCSLKIEDRRNVLNAGFSEQEKSTKNAFEEVLISKWLSYFDGNFLKFISGIKFDADESDVESTDVITKKLMKIFFKKQDIKDIINSLPLGEDKLLPLDKLSTETILFWHNLHSYLIENKEYGENLDTIVPELTVFSNYIKKYLEENSNKKFEYWEFLEYQFIVQKMFEMAGQFDLSDEVGKRNLRNLITTSLQEMKLIEPLTKVLVKILDQIFANVEVLQENIVDIITNIRAEDVVEPTNETDLVNWRFKVAEMKMKVNEMTEKLEDAIRKRELKEALNLEALLNKSKEELKLLEEQKPGCVIKKVVLSEELIINKCLDLLNALLNLSSVRNLNVMVQGQITEFKNLPHNVDVYPRVFKLLSLAATCDKKCATEHWKTICAPIKMYRIMPYSKEEVMFIALPAFTDLLSLYGPTLFINEDSLNTTKRPKNIRRLYNDNNPDYNETESILHDAYTVDDILEILTDMLDDESAEMREKSAKCVAKLIYNGIMVTPGILARVMLKCCSSTYADQNPQINQLFILATFRYCSKINGNEEIVERAVESVLTSILNEKSNLSELDVDTVIKYLTNVTSQKRNKEGYLIHQNLSYTFCNIILNNINGKTSLVYAKILLNLNIPNEERIIKELKDQVNTILQGAQEKILRVRLNKYISNLQVALQRLENSTNSTNLPTASATTINTNLETIVEESEVEKDNAIEENTNIIAKRRKQNTCDDKEDESNKTNTLITQLETEENGGEKNIEKANYTNKESKKMGKRRKQNSSDDSEDDKTEADNNVATKMVSSKTGKSKHKNKKVKVISNVLINLSNQIEETVQNNKPTAIGTLEVRVNVLRSPKIAKMLKERRSNEENISNEDPKLTPTKTSTEIPLKPINLNKTDSFNSTGIEDNHRKTRSLSNLSINEKVAENKICKKKNSNNKDENLKSGIIFKSSESSSNSSSNDSFITTLTKLKKYRPSLPNSSSSSEEFKKRPMKRISEQKQFKKPTSSSDFFDIPRKKSLRLQKNSPPLVSSSEFLNSPLRKLMTAPIKNSALRSSPRKSARNTSKRKASPKSPVIKNKKYKIKSPEKNNCNSIKSSSSSNSSKEESNRRFSSSECFENSNNNLSTQSFADLSIDSASSDSSKSIVLRVNRLRKNQSQNIIKKHSTPKKNVRKSIRIEDDLSSQSISKKKKPADLNTSLKMVRLSKSSTNSSLLSRTLRSNSQSSFEKSVTLHKHSLRKEQK